MDIRGLGGPGATFPYRDILYCQEIENHDNYVSYSFLIFRYTIYRVTPLYLQVSGRQVFRVLVDYR